MNDYKHNLSFIDLITEEPSDNVFKVVDLLSKAKGYIWLINNNFNPNSFHPISLALKEKPEINEVRILIKRPHTSLDLEDIKYTFEKFRDQYKDDFKIQMKIFTDKKLVDSIHDRYLFTKDTFYNFIELDSLARKQRADICELPKDYLENRTKEDFIKRWEDKKTFDIINQWKDIEGVVKKHESNKLEDIHKKNKSEQSTQHKHKTVITYFKTNKGKTVLAKDNIPIEMHEAIKECKNLEINIEYNDLPYIGFTNTGTDETLQFRRLSEEKWYAESPIINRENNKWEGYSWKAYGTWEQVKHSIEIFFEEESRGNIFDWKISRFPQWVSKEILEDERKRAQKLLVDLK